jgi:hypothetical protein
VLVQSRVATIDSTELVSRVQGIVERRTENNMRPIRMFCYASVAVVLGGVVAVGQNTLAPTTDNKPPTDSVKVFTFADLQSKIKGAQTGRLLEGQELFSLNLLHRTAEPATVHGDLVDLYWIQEGSATFRTKTR